MFEPTRHRRHHREHGRGRGPGPGPEFAGPWSPRLFLEQFRGGGHPMRRGEIRPLILAALETKPMHGYEVIQALEAQSGGRWRPSAGSVYPTLQQLADESLVAGEEIDGRRTYTLTDAGRAAAAAAPIPEGRWGRRRGRDDGDMRSLAMQLVGAAMQVERVGSAATQQEARTILVDARRRIYRLLAEDTEAAETAPGDPGTADSDVSVGGQDDSDQ